jgi:NADH-quinone oxidoreductase subunit J
MTIQFILFAILALVAIASALGMMFSRNAVYSALFLIVNFGSVAVFYMQLQAPFISLAQVTVYAGAIMVLFLFVIMLLGAEQLRGDGQVMRWQRPLAISLGLILLVETFYIILTRTATSTAFPSAAVTFGSPEAVGEILFDQYLLPFEVTSVLLLVAMIGAIVLTKRKI